MSSKEQKLETKTAMQKKLDELMESWKNYSKSKEKWPNEPFVTDGAFPEYKKQKIKILFIGRESYGGDEDSDYIQKRCDGEMKATSKFHSRLLYIAYGIINGEYTYDDWLKMKDSRELNRAFAEKDGFSFAFMNASKLNNHSKSTSVGAGLFFEFINDPQRDNHKFFLEEIKILDPDIIISGNLGDVGFMSSFLNRGKNKKNKTVRIIDCSNENYLYYELTLGGRDIPWLDGRHFSAWRCEDFEDFYEPICTKAKDIFSVKK